MTTQDKKRKHDELASSHTSMLRVLQSKTLPKDTRAKKITTRIHADRRVYELESYRDESGEIGHSINTTVEEMEKKETSLQKPVAVSA